jgi:hypothetical protein
MPHQTPVVVVVVAHIIPQVIKAEMAEVELLLFDGIRQHN